jgi:hypothetical protein
MKRMNDVLMRDLMTSDKYTGYSLDKDLYVNQKYGQSKGEIYQEEELLSNIQKKKQTKRN